MLKEVTDDICWFRFTQELLSHHDNECPGKELQGIDNERLVR